METINKTSKTLAKQFILFIFVLFFLQYPFHESFHALAFYLCGATEIWFTVETGSVVTYLTHANGDFTLLQICFCALAGGLLTSLVLLPLLWKKWLVGCVCITQFIYGIVECVVKWQSEIINTDFLILYSNINPYFLLFEFIFTGVFMLIWLKKYMDGIPL